MFEKLLAFIIAITAIVYSFLLSTFGMMPKGLYPQVLYQGKVYSDKLNPNYRIPATLEKDAPELTYVGKISSISKRFATPTEELQGNMFPQWHDEIYLHEDGYLYAFTVLGGAYTLTHSLIEP